MTPRHSTLPLLALLALAGCGETGAGPKSVASLPAPRAVGGVDRVIGHDARTLTALFGAPKLDLHEGPAHKLQFRGAACVLDAYLYPPAGGGEPRVTWIDTRTPTGADFDRASCVAALSRR